MELLLILLDSTLEFLGAPLFDAKDFWKLILHLLPGGLNPSPYLCLYGLKKNYFKKKYFLTN